ncbi:hypothetical protein F4779DRAFT_331631 [Xylariaceae sp. FL0662B]|nr:hypothetical protein F4779DRAFT_331631 [Xylariaceae sp. FL0662B]
MQMRLTNRNATTFFPSVNANLFHGAAGTCGTLGGTSMFQVQLRRSGKCVKLSYTPGYSILEVVSLMNNGSYSGCDYIYAILFSINLKMVIVGRTIDHKPKAHQQEAFIIGPMSWSMLTPASTWHAYPRHIAILACFRPFSRILQSSRSVQHLFPLDHLFSI